MLPPCHHSHRKPLPTILQCGGNEGGSGGSLGGATGSPCKFHFFWGPGELALSSATSGVGAERGGGGGRGSIGSTQKLQVGRSFLTDYKSMACVFESTQNSHPYSNARNTYIT